jgi:hypothetical protein
MLSVFDRIKQALTDHIMLSKVDLFEVANIVNSTSNRAMFQILIQNGKLIPTGEGRARKYHLPVPIAPVGQLPSDGIYEFKQNGNGKIILVAELEEPITFQSYEECASYIKRRFANG